MRRALYILGQLDDTDVEWLAQHGVRRSLQDNEVLVREGGAIDSLFITLSGRLRVVMSSGEELAHLSAGEVVGEISFVDSAPPDATVSAMGDASVLALPRAALQQRLARDNGFAARFYRALAIFLADRLRTTTQRLAYGAPGDLDTDDILEDELDIGVLDAVSQAGERFTRLLRTLGAVDGR